MSRYRLISSDSHIIEPVDLWQKRIDRKFRDRAPRLVHEEHTDQWYCDGVAFGAVGATQQAGLRFEEPEKLTNQGSMETVPIGGLDPQAHVKDMDADGIAGGVLYPSQGLTLWCIPASDLLSASFRAYNDYVAEFCKAIPRPAQGHRHDQPGQRRGRRRGAASGGTDGAGRRHDRGTSHATIRPPRL